MVITGQNVLGKISMFFGAVTTSFRAETNPIMKRWTVFQGAQQALNNFYRSFRKGTAGFRTVVALQPEAPFWVCAERAGSIDVPPPLSSR